MFERFTESARQAIVLAQEESRDLRHDYIGTEHLLLGLLRESDGLPARVLGAHGVTPERARRGVIALVGTGEAAMDGQIPFTPRARQALELSLRQAMTLGHNYIGSTHLLLGVLSEGDGVAVRVLADMGVAFEPLWEDLLQSLAEKGSTVQPEDMPLPLSEEVDTVLRTAERVARSRGAAEVEPSHLREVLGEDPENSR